MASTASRKAVDMESPTLSLPVVEFAFERIKIRIVGHSGAPWFVAADVCGVLGISNVTMAVSRLDDDEVTLSQIEGSHRKTNIISESGLYSLVLRSDKPAAKRFRKWVTAEVLPSIRKNGFYAMQGISAANEAAHRGRPPGLSVDLPEKARLVWAYLEPRLSAESWTPIALSDVATGSGVRYSSVSTVVNALVDRKLLWRRKGPHQKAPNEYRLRVEGSTRDAPKIAVERPAAVFMDIPDRHAIVDGLLIDMTPMSYRKGERVAVRLRNGNLGLYTLLEDAPDRHFLFHHCLSWIGRVDDGVRSSEGYRSHENVIVIGRVVGPALPPPADAG